MKKIMFMLVTVLAVACAHAGAVKWSALNVYGSDGATKNTGIGYLFAASDMSAVTAALAGSDSSSAATTIAGLAVSDFTPTVAGNYAPTTGVAYDTGAATFFAVIFDGASIADSSTYYMTTTKSATVPGSGTATVAFGNQSVNTFGKTDAFASAGWAGSSGGGTPEPTSGLLLLVGGALLALRRKQK